jgi:hypothetical protein
MKKTPSRWQLTHFPLIEGEWYEMAVIDGGEEMPSPIRVDEVTRGPRGRLRLGFDHADYPDGVRDKVYELRITTESAAGLKAKSLDVKGRQVRIRRLRGPTVE